MGKSFTFRCHRTAEEYSAVNCIDFHPSQGTFATVGSDGAYVFWDKENKQRLSQSAPGKCPISTAKFSANGDIFAYATSYDWSRAHDASFVNLPHQIMLHPVRRKDVEVRAKS